MSLELKHLAPYLPYELNIINGVDTFKMISLSKDNVFFNGGLLSIQEIKPILRPLSNLTKEIEVNGEKFIPIDKMEELGWYNMDCVNPQKVKCIPLEMASFLFRWHFDIFGLIDKELAININILQNEKHS